MRGSGVRVPSGASLFFIGIPKIMAIADLYPQPPFFITNLFLIFLSAEYAHPFEDME